MLLSTVTIYGGTFSLSNDELWRVIIFAGCKHASPVNKLQQWSQDEDRLSKMLRSPLSIRFRAIRITAKLFDNDSRL